MQRSGTLTLHAADTGDLIRVLEVTTASLLLPAASGCGDAGGSGEQPTVVCGLDATPHAVLVGYTGGLMRVWDTRTARAAITVRSSSGSSGSGGGSIDPLRASAPALLVAALGRRAGPTLEPLHMPGSTAVTQWWAEAAGGDASAAAGAAPGDGIVMRWDDVHGGGLHQQQPPTSYGGLAAAAVDHDCALTHMAALDA
jgi:hypothetical protein